MTDFAAYSGKSAYISSQSSPLYQIGLKRLNELHGYGLKSGEPISHQELSKANVARLENWKAELIATLDPAEKTRFNTGFKRLEAAFGKVNFYWKHGTAEEETVRKIMAVGHILSGEVVLNRTHGPVTGYANTDPNEAAARKDTQFVYFRVETHTDAMETGFGDYQFVVRTDEDAGWMNDSWITLRDMLFPYGKDGVKETPAGPGKEDGGYLRRTEVRGENLASKNAVVTGALFTHYFTEFRSYGNHQENIRNRTESVFEGAFYGPADIKKGIMLSLCRAMFELPPFWQEILDAAESDLPKVIAGRLKTFFNIEGKVPVSLKVGPEVKDEDGQNTYKFKTGVSLPIWKNTVQQEKAARASTSSKGKEASTSQKTETPPPKYAGDYAGTPRTGAATQVGGGGLVDPSKDESDDEWNVTIYDF